MDREHRRSSADLALRVASDPRDPDRRWDATRRRPAPSLIGPRPPLRHRAQSAASRRDRRKSRLRRPRSDRRGNAKCIRPFSGPASGGRDKSVAAKRTSGFGADFFSGLRRTRALPRPPAGVRSPLPLGSSAARSALPRRSITQRSGLPAPRRPGRGCPEASGRALAGGPYHDTTAGCRPLGNPAARPPMLSRGDDCVLPGGVV